MTEQKCKICKEFFIEKLSQYYKRIKIIKKILVKQDPICTFCRRSRAAKIREDKKKYFRKNQTNSTIHPNDSELIAKAIELKHENNGISNPFLQSRLKITYEKAEEILKKIND